jgi:ATPase subunit of ABC transporter with duplicated ATPase domains
MIRGGLTDKPEEEKPLNFKFADPGKLVPPVLAFHDVQFGYPGCQPLYTNVNLGVDLDSRVALVGPVCIRRACWLSRHPLSYAKLSWFLLWLST